eukprot:CAMPEP_0183295534 /NCGR_PEP_ID=MMETSP0160_2-20130417/3458_1 /TAXON_ID=2839 ORGANISM="Odontella Sinensis, Strain Grunow 1884" /NCGR_SAMPLE_ID=MMETSP0160_2 /ASSEMBLY_ACC=CAM_ASM_000250 /LENGTH=87 /DNA_ID=CAMNT_0025457029 /DNA_START=221 /DNA_END=481 /DNA_ORIENTATION=+
MTLTLDGFLAGIFCASYSSFALRNIVKISNLSPLFRSSPDVTMSMHRSGVLPRFVSKATLGGNACRRVRTTRGDAPTLHATWIGNHP